MSVDNVVAGIVGDEGFGSAIRSHLEMWGYRQPTEHIPR